jgi:hypothetical protein
MCLDRRLGNTPRWFISAPKDAKMRVPENALKCVCFVGLADVHPEAEKGWKVSLGGTAFFVWHQSEFDPMFAHVYLVTAKHVAAAIQGRNFVVRMNSKDQEQAIWVQGRREDRFYFHPTDPSVDVAVIPYGPARDKFDYEPLPTTMFLTDEIVRSGSVGPGDEVFLTGLFVHFAGSKKNIPIVRYGNIAMLPTEKVPTKIGDIDAYLIEARSIGGLSGSPAFVRETVNITIDEEGKGEIFSAPSGRGTYLMGLMHGHWDIPPQAKNDMRTTDEEGQVNMGIAIVVPATKILEVINQKELTEIRRESAAERKKKQPKPTMDTAFPTAGTQKTKAGATIPAITRGEFLKQLEKATRRRKP